jgi:hypothetical protein
MTACRHWYTEGWLIAHRKHLRSEVSTQDLCVLCDAAANRSVDRQAFHRVSADGQPRLYLQGDKSLHYAVEDRSFHTRFDQTVYLTPCGWWVPHVLFTGRSQGSKLPAMCENCTSSSYGHEPETR